jgi:aspartyl-tRNA(Asn)/glutamyl-tRNA(Gln) amidotransferase subunit A
MKLNTLTVKKAIQLLQAKKISHSELYTDIYGVIEQQNNNLNVYVSVDKNAATKAEKCIHKPLAGIPLSVKDNFLTVDFPTTASADVLRNFYPPYESTVTRRLQDAGAVIIGKTNMDAWAHGSSTETSDFGSTKNPRNPHYSPGGSSGGSAAAVAADMCIGSIGSETAGSIRQPSSWCGVVGFKPTYGRVSRAGVVSMASSTDSPGPIGKTVEDTALLLNYIAGNDVYDATTSPIPVEDYTKYLTGSVKGLRIGICYTDHGKLRGKIAAMSVEEAGKVFEKLGAYVSRVELSETLTPGRILTPDYAISVYTVVQRSEVSSNLARYDGIRYGEDRSKFGLEAKRRIMLGTFTLSKGYSDRYYNLANKIRQLYIENFQELFTRYDVLISPTTAGFAEKSGTSLGNPMFGEIEDMLLEPSSISGLTGINVPCYHEAKTNLSLGLNIIANQWQECRVFQAAYAFEQHTGWNPWIKSI